MKIAIPMSQGVLSSHFGHCEEFAFLDVDEGTRTVRNEQRLPPPPHEPGVLPKWLVANHATVAIVGGMGMRARELLEQAGVQVIMGAPEWPPAKLVEAYLAGRLTGGNNPCSHGSDHVCQGHGNATGHADPHHPVRGR